MINLGPNFKHSIALSSSKCDTYIHCSAKYAANYIYKLPDRGNDGSSRGSATHQVLEILVKDKWLNLVNSVIKEKTCKKFPALWRLVKIYAKQFNVADETNLNMIDGFIVVGLKVAMDEKPQGLTETIVEKAFDFEVTDGPISYRVRGFIDLIYISLEDKTLIIKILDYKSSKQKFSKDKQKSNMQSLIYQNVIRRLFPEYKLDSFKFVFLKFPNSPIQVSESVDEITLYGFEMYLTSLQSNLENFTEKNIGDNYGALNPKYKNLCGKEEHGFKPDGSPIWVCPARLPMDYYVLLDSKGEIKKSAFAEQELSPKDGEKIEKRRYGGCSFFFDPKTEEKRNYHYSS
jgi:hypothetical protein